MNPALRSLLVAVGAAVATGAVVYTYRDTLVTFAQRQDAGIAADCNPRIAITKERLGPRLRARLVDGGAVLRPGQRYARLARQAQRCANPDGGTYELFVAGLEYLRDAAGGSDDESDSDVGMTVILRARPCADMPGFCGNGPQHVALASQALDPHPCARKTPDGGTCTLLGGGEPGVWNTFDSSRLMGAGCQPVECAVYAGEDPEEVL